MPNFDSIDFEALQPFIASRIKELVLLPEETLIEKFNLCCSYDSAFSKAAHKALGSLGEGNIMLSHLATWVVIYEQKERFGLEPIN